MSYRVCSMVTDHCTLLLADSALSHTSLAANSSHNSGSQADSDINMPLDHLTPSSAPLTPTTPQQQDHAHMANGIHGNEITTPTPLEAPKK